MSKLKQENEMMTQELTALTKSKGRVVPHSSLNTLPAFPLPCRLNDLRFTIEKIGPKISEDDLKNYFDEFGEVIDVFFEESLEIKSKQIRTAHISFSHFNDSWPDRHHVICKTPLTVENVLQDSKKPSKTVVVIGDIQELSGESIAAYVVRYGDINDFRRTVNWKTNKLSRLTFVKFQTEAAVTKILNVEKHVIEGVQVDIIAVPNY